MIIVDPALDAREREGRPVRVAIVGLGYMGRAIARQFLRPVPGMRLAAVFNRTPAEAERTFREAGHDAPLRCASAAQLGQALQLDAGRARLVDQVALVRAGASRDEQRVPAAGGQRRGDADRVTRRTADVEAGDDAQHLGHGCS